MSIAERTNAVLDKIEAMKSTEERIKALEDDNAMLTAQVSALSDQMDFYEECIVEMAEVVYA